MLLKKPRKEEILRFQYAVTYICNSRCILCYIWKLYKEEPELLKKELSLENIKERLPKHSLKHIMQLSFTGGEPFLRKDFAQLYIHFATLFPKSYIYIVTNGLAPSLIIDTLKDIKKYTSLKRLKIGLSIDGREGMHDKIRGVKGAYKNALQTLEGIRKAFGSMLSLEINFTLIPQNIDEINDVYSLSREYNAHFTARFAQVSSIYYHNEKMQFLWEEEGLKRAEEYLRSIGRKIFENASILRRLFGLDTYFLYNASIHQRRKERLFCCFSGTHSFFLDPYGRIFPCINLERAFGSIMEEKFDKIWNGKEADKIRRYIKEKKCHCWTECEVYPSLQRSIKPILWNIKCLLSPS